MMGYPATGRKLRRGQGAGREARRLLLRICRLFHGRPYEDHWLGEGWSAGAMRSIRGGERSMDKRRFGTCGDAHPGAELWFHLINVWGATAASSYHFLMPPLGVLFGWLLLGEHVAGADLLGIVPVAIGIYLVTRPCCEEVNTGDRGQAVSCICSLPAIANRSAVSHGRSE